MIAATVYSPHPRRRIQITSLIAALCFLVTSRGSAQPELRVTLPERAHPYLACTAEELARLRQAYRAQGAEHNIVAEYEKETGRFTDEPVAFPPRGGQHNQWYQCDHCEIALRTIDSTHHQCPRCQKVYSGPPYDDVIFSSQHNRNLRQMLTAAWAYMMSGDKRFAEYAAKVLLGYSERYAQYPYHSNSLDPQSKNRSGGHLFEQTLNEAVCLATQVGPAYDLIHDSGVLSAADHEKIHEGLLLPMLRNMDKNKTGQNNWQTWHNAAMIWGGALVKDPTWVQKAIADPKNGFSYQMKVSVSREGMWYENSWGYHFYTLQALVNMAETARRLDIDLWSDARLKGMFTLPVHYTMADGMLPRFGDDTGSSIRNVGRLFEPAYHAYRDPQILSLLSSKPGFESILLGRRTDVTATPPALTSIIVEDAGHAILRTGGPAGLTAAMTFGPYGGFHGHYDKLSFVFFGHKRELGVDPGRARSQAYRLPIHGNWYKATISHNTVLVDGQSQRPATGKLLRFEEGAGYATVAAGCDQAYPGVQHTRRLVMTEAYLLVLDQLQSDTEHRFDWLYHNQGRKTSCEVARESVSLTGKFPGVEYIQNATQGLTADTVRIRFEDAAVPTHLTMAAGQGTTVTVGDGVGESVTDRVPMAMVGRTGRSALFAAVLEPVPAGSEPRVTDVQLVQAGDGLKVIVGRGGTTDVIVVHDDQDVSVALSPSPAPSR